MNIFKTISNYYPGLDEKLEQAGILKKPSEFVKQMCVLSTLMTFVIFIICLGLTSIFPFKNLTLFLIVICSIVFFFLYFMKYPDMKILKLDKELNKEIIYAGRFLVVELESGVSVYNALKTCSSNYKVIGKYMDEIISKVDFGTTLEEALSDTIKTTPSTNFRKLLWQLLNSLKTGADVARSLNSVIEQVTKEQIIEVKEYGRKLNPLAMFYMLAAIIMPSIGIIMLIIVSAFMGINLSLAALLSMAGFIGFIQFMFYNIIKSKRPAIEL
jgi:archaeal flagellar protein FlaJ